MEQFLEIGCARLVKSITEVVKMVNGHGNE
jgi:hypothetical protein